MRNRFRSSFFLAFLMAINCALLLVSSGAGSVIAHNDKLATFPAAGSPIRIEIDSPNCAVWDYCEENPELRLGVFGPEGFVENYTIHLSIGAKKMEFDTNPANTTLGKTGESGVEVVFWAESEEGKIFAKDSFHLRNLQVEDKFLFEILGKRWESSAPGCSVVWKIFPKTDLYTSGWAQVINDPNQLYTEIDYTLLAGRLIWDGKVDASLCDNSGLLRSGVASQCGLEAAREAVLAWQNEANAVIQGASLQAGIPARLLKGLIGQESQFYSGWERKDEYGLGMISERGVDMLLYWNPSYYKEKCEQFLGKGTCAAGYLNLTKNYQAQLIGLVLKDIGSLQEYRLLAQTLYAGCHQSAQLVRNYTKKEASEVADYATMWRITMGIYHSGCGCVGDAMEAAWESYEFENTGLKNQQLKWVDIADNLDKDCLNAVDYFDKIVRYGG